jgi:hypothetical protein
VEEASQESSRNFALGFCHHALEVEVRLYDRLFSDEAPDSHKEKNFIL